MAKFNAIIEAIQNSTDYGERNQFLEYILNCFNHPGSQPDEEDKALFSAFIFPEVKKLIKDIPPIASYRKKDTAMEYARNLINIIPRCHATPESVPDEDRDNIRELIEILDKESFIEAQIEEIFAKGNNSPADIDRLFCMLIPIKDEYQKGLFYQGMLHFKQAIPDMPEESCQKIEEYIKNELQRYLSCELNEDIIANLEFACDVSKFFFNEKIGELLTKILAFGINNISFFAAETLLFADFPVPQETINALARDLIYADNTYSMLKKLKKTKLFPAEFAKPEYLAKSNLVHWLSYPTELGKAPDEIEYLGKVRKGGVYYIFRYKSESDTLDSETKGKWLIGWANNDGGTFSNFDLYDNFAQKTPGKTLRYIKKKLL